MKQSFGKGLESLIPKKQGDDEKGQEKKDPVFYIEINKIRSNPYQPRKNFDQSGLEALADSIRDHGVLQPLLVSRLEKDSGSVEYQLVAGERRLLASKMVGLNQVPVIVREPTEQEKLEISLIENVQRLDLNAMEKAEAYKRLQDEFKLLQKDIARMVGKSREAVTNTMRLLDLPDDARRALREERITEGHARAILAVETPQKQKALLAQVLKNGISVREAESFAQKLKIWRPVKRHVSSAAKEVKDLEEKIRGMLGIKNLRLNTSGGRPKLTVFFNSKKELEKFLEKFKP